MNDFLDEYVSSFPGSRTDQETGDKYGPWLFQQLTTGAEQWSFPLDSETEKNPQKSSMQEVEKPSESTGVVLGTCDDCNDEATHKQAKDCGEGPSERSVTVGIRKHKIVKKAGLHIEVGDQADRWNKEGHCEILRRH